MKMYIVFAPVFILLFSLAPSLAAGEPQQHVEAGLPAALDRIDLQWFKDEMRISPQYIEAHEGILGMSWLHFILMLFLVIFFFGTLVAYFRQTNRTRRILQQLLGEED